MTRALVIGALLAAPIVAQRPLNLDFERASVSHADRPWGWTLGWSAFAQGASATFTLDGTVRRSGRFGLRVGSTDTTAGPQTLMLQLPADFARGRTVSLAVWARADGGHGQASVTLEAWRDQAFAAADTVVTGPGDWTRFSLHITVPDDPLIHSIVVGLTLTGAGTVWYDDLDLAVDGQSIAALPRTAEPPTATQLTWLRRQAEPLTSVEARSGDGNDMHAIGAIVGTARIVGLGESTHGTREFFQVKHRILEYLVREHGFRVFAIEANQIAVEQVNAYVHGGPGTAADAMRVMFQVWNTASMVDLVDWIRDHNARHPGATVRFAGYDMQDHRRPVDTLRAILGRLAPALVHRVDSLAGEYRSQPSYATPQVPGSVRARWSAQADTLWQLVLGVTGDDTVARAWAVQSANLFRQAARFNVALSSPERDSLMAANLDWLLRTLAPDQRAVVWAHDVHVSRGGDPALSFNGGAQMGAHLATTFGHDYRALTLLTWDGAYSATRSFTDHEIIAAEAFPGPPGSLEDALHRLPRPDDAVGWVVDLRPARRGDGGAWLRVPRPIRHVGYAAYDYGFEFSAVLPLEFDGVVFVDRTRPSRIVR